MSHKEAISHEEIPDALRQQFGVVQRRLWRVVAARCGVNQRHVWRVVAASAMPYAFDPK